MRKKDVKPIHFKFNNIMPKLIIKIIYLIKKNKIKIKRIALVIMLK